MKVMVNLSKKQMYALIYSVGLFIHQLKSVDADLCIISGVSVIGDRVASLLVDCPDDSVRDLELTPFECGLVSEALQCGNKYKHIRFTIYPQIIEGMYKSPYFD